MKNLIGRLFTKKSIVKPTKEVVAQELSDLTSRTLRTFTNTIEELEAIEEKIKLEEDNAQLDIDDLQSKIDSIHIVKNNLLETKEYNIRIKSKIKKILE